LAILVILLLIK